MEISVALYNRIHDYLQQRLEALEVGFGDQNQQDQFQDLDQVKALLREMPQELSPADGARTSGQISQTSALNHLFSAPDLTKFPQQLLEAWQAIASDEIGENFWSYPVRILDVAAEMSLPVEQLVASLGSANIPNLQLIKNRGHNYQIGNTLAAAIAFHPPSEADQKSGQVEIISQVALPKSHSVAQADPQFLVGDRVRVNQQRPQYALQTGTVTQVISVSCRVQLDNGWSAFLPHHCLEKI